MVQIDGATKAVMAAKTQAWIHPSGVTCQSTRMLCHSGFLLPGHALLEREIGILGTLGAVNFYLKVLLERVLCLRMLYGVKCVFSKHSKRNFRLCCDLENVGEHLLVVVVCFRDIIKRTDSNPEMLLIINNSALSALLIALFLRSFLPEDSVWPLSPD